MFQRLGGAWKLATVVNHSDSGAPSWPALCRTGTGATARVVLAPADYEATLTRALNHAATGVTETAAAAASFAVNSFFSGSGSFYVQSANQIKQDRAGGVTVANRFSPAADPALALPLADGRGCWLVGALVQTCTYGSAAGFSKATWPDGSSVASARLAVVHHQTDTFITTYTATDPLRSTGGKVALDGFFGWSLPATASQGAQPSVWRHLTEVLAAATTTAMPPIWLICTRRHRRHPSTRASNNRQGDSVWPWTIARHSACHGA